MEEYFSCVFYFSFSIVFILGIIIALQTVMSAYAYLIVCMYSHHSPCNLLFYVKLK